MNFDKMSEKTPDVYNEEGRLLLQSKDNLFEAHTKPSIVGKIAPNNSIQDFKENQEFLPQLPNFYEAGIFLEKPTFKNTTENFAMDTLQKPNVKLECKIRKETQDMKNVSYCTSFEEDKESKNNQGGAKKRWRREDDKRLFSVIRSLEREGHLTLEELTHMNPATEACGHKGVSMLAKIFEWKSLKKHLVIRIQSLVKRDFSVRETKNLKRILKKEYNYENLNYEKIIYEFPGKSFARLIEVCDHIVKNRYEKTLTSYCLKQK